MTNDDIKFYRGVPIDMHVKNCEAEIIRLRRIEDAALASPELRAKVEELTRPAAELPEYKFMFDKMLKVEAALRDQLAAMKLERDGYKLQCEANYSETDTQAIMRIGTELAAANAKVEELSNKLKGAQATAAGYGLCIGLKKMGRDSFIRKAVDRFLCWKLPKGFAPDAGISFKPTKPYEGDKYGNSWWPIGTNLFDAEQTRAMFEHCVPEDSVIMHKVEEQLAAMTKERDFLLGKILLCDNALAAKDAVIERLRSEFNRYVLFTKALREGEESLTHDGSLFEASLMTSLNDLKLSQSKAADFLTSCENDASALEARLAQDRERICALYSPDDTAGDFMDKIREMK